MSKKTYAQAINESLKYLLSSREDVFVMGQGINDVVGMFGGTTDLYKTFGEERVFDTPIAETGLTGIAVGASMYGMRPIYCHNRPDFMYLAMDQIVNHASKYCYMSGGQIGIPIVFWSVTGQGWGSAAQHSQAIHALFQHVPGLKVVMPASPCDVKGLFISSVYDNNPVIILDHRRCFSLVEEVPDEPYEINLGSGRIVREGDDVTILAISAMVIDAMEAANVLEHKGVSAEIIDPRTIKPFDYDLLLSSIRKTHRLVIADTGWKTGGVSAEISAAIYELAFKDLTQPIERISLPDIPTPAAYTLEEAFYRTPQDIIDAVMRMM